MRMKSTRDVCDSLLDLSCLFISSWLALSVCLSVLGPRKLLILYKWLQCELLPRAFPNHPPSHPHSGTEMPFFWAPQIPTHSSNVLFVPLTIFQSVPTSDCGNRGQDPILSLWVAQLLWMKESWLNGNWMEHLQGHWASVCPYSFFIYWFTR